MELDKTIGLQENDFAVVIGENFKLDDLRIEAAFKLHWQVGHFITPHPRFIDPGGQYIFSIFRNLNVGADTGHVEILNEFYSSSDVEIFTLHPVSSDPKATRVAICPH